MEAKAYYELLSEKFALFTDVEESPAPGQVIYNKETKARWTPLTCTENDVDFDLFVKGHLETHKTAEENIEEVTE